METILIFSIYAAVFAALAWAIMQNNRLTRRVAALTSQRDALTEKFAKYRVFSELSERVASDLIEAMEQDISEMQEQLSAALKERDTERQKVKEVGDVATLWRNCEKYRRANQMQETEIHRLNAECEKLKNTLETTRRAFKGTSQMFETKVKRLQKEVDDLKAERRILRTDAAVGEPRGYVLRSKKGYYFKSLNVENGAIGAVQKRRHAFVFTSKQAAENVQRDLPTKWTLEVF